MHKFIRKIMKDIAKNAQAPVAEFNLQPRPGAFYSFLLQICTKAIADFIWNNRDLAEDFSVTVISH